MSFPLSRDLPRNEAVSQTISALGHYVTIVRPNSRAMGVTLSGTWTGTIQFFYTVDDVNWLPCPMVSLSGNSGTPVTQATGNGTWIAAFVPVGSGFMARSSAWTSGTATVAANCAG